MLFRVGKKTYTKAHKDATKSTKKKIIKKILSNKRTLNLVYS